MTRYLLAASASAGLTYLLAVRPLRRQLDAERLRGNHLHLDYQLRHRTGRVLPPRGMRAS